MIVVLKEKKSLISVFIITNVVQVLKEVTILAKIVVTEVWKMKGVVHICKKRFDKGVEK